MTPMDYSIMWTKNMLDNATSVHAISAENKALHGAPLPIYRHAVFAGVILGLFLIAYAWRQLRLSTEMKLLAFTAVSYIAVVLINNYMLHLKYHAIVAIHSRYILLVVPIVILLMVLAGAYITRKRRYFQIAIVGILLLVISQGGGLIPHIIRSDENWFRKNVTVLRLNEGAKSVLKPLVIESLRSK